MKISLSILLLLASSPLAAQTDVTVTIDPSKAQSVARIAVPFTELTGVTVEQLREPFFGPLTRDLAYSGSFAMAPLPPNVAITTDVARRAGANYLLTTRARMEGDDFVIDAHFVDMSGESLFPGGGGKRYRAPAAALTRTAHMLANDILRATTGRTGIFMSQIAFSSNRTGHMEIWLMDWDGNNQRQITTHRSISIHPSWAPDNERMAYTTFVRGTSDVWIVNRRGGGRMRLNSGVNLNTSATFSPVGREIAFVGSVNGNPDIYVMRDDGANIRRLTNAGSIESTPEWSPNGRQISFTSGRSGSPQIYVMDAEGTNVRRISFDGDWNDDATWSGDGERIAYTSRVAGRFQIRIFNSIKGESRIVAGEGSNEQPTWSPDGQWIAFQSNRSGKWQIYRMRADGTELLQLTFNGENKGPDWSKKAE